MLRDLRDISVLFGRNGSGKSLLLRGLHESADPAGTHYASPERSGEIAYDQSLMQQEIAPASRGAGRRGRNLAPQYRRESISRLATLTTVIGQHAGRGEPVHQKRILTAVESSLADLLPEFRFESVAEPPLFAMHRVGPGDMEPTPVPDPTTQLSSGESEALTLALDLLTICNIWELECQRQRVLLVDEPDPHLHPDLQVRLARFLVGLSPRFDAQLIIATHSTTMLAAIGHYRRERVARSASGRGAPATSTQCGSSSRAGVRRQARGGPDPERAPWPEPGGRGPP